MKTDPYFANRRTIRKYSDKEISNHEIEAMLEAASHAPNTGNMQLYSVVISRDETTLSKLRAAHFNQPASHAPVLLTFCADMNRFEKWCAERKAEPGMRNLQMLMCAAIDTSLVAQQFVTIAEQNGLGTCYLGTTTYNAGQISEALELPDGVIALTTVSLGYPAEAGEDSGRLPVKAIVHEEKYRDYTPDDIEEHYAEKESREDSKQFVKENGKETLAQVFTDVRYPKTTNEAFSDTFREHLAEKGFKL